MAGAAAPLEELIRRSVEKSYFVDTCLDRHCNRVFQRTRSQRTDYANPRFRSIGGQTVGRVDGCWRLWIGSLGNLLPLPAPQNRTVHIPPDSELSFHWRCHFDFTAGFSCRSAKGKAECSPAPSSMGSLTADNGRSFFNFLADFFSALPRFVLRNRPPGRLGRRVRCEFAAESQRSWQRFVDRHGDRGWKAEVWIAVSVEHRGQRGDGSYHGVVVQHLVTPLDPDRLIQIDESII